MSLSLDALPIRKLEAALEQFAAIAEDLKS